MAFAEVVDGFHAQCATGEAVGFAEAFHVASLDRVQPEDAEVGELRQVPRAFTVSVGEELDGVVPGIGVDDELFGAHLVVDPQAGEELAGVVFVFDHQNGCAWIVGQVAAVNLEWIQADGTTQSAITPFISNGTFTAADAPVDVWTLQTITGEAPADAAFARLVIITGDFLPGGPGGAPFYDDAFFELMTPVDNEDTSFGAIKSLSR